MSVEAGSANTDDEAVIWALKLSSGVLSDADADCLGDWLSSPKRLTALSRAYAVLTTVVPPTAVPRNEAERTVSRRQFLALSIMAGLGVAAVGGGMRYLGGRYWYATDVGEMAHVALPDGSMAILNTNTEIAATFTQSDRYVKLVRGEALLDVELDVVRLFSLEARGVLVQSFGARYPRSLREDHSRLGALIDFARDIARPLTRDPLRAGFEARGTTVAMRIKPGDEVEAAVLEGTFEVRRRAPKRFDTTALSSNTLLSAWPDAYPEIRAIDTESLEAKLAWLERRLSFVNGATVGDAVKEFNRYNELRLLASERMAGRQIRGVFAVDQPLTFVSVIEKATGTRARHADGTVTI